jgi:ubiquinone/menaquinone biosynthesis C-methylase UbiE
VASELPLRGPHDPGTRAGRFHTVRGSMGPSGWLRYPAAWLRAKRGGTPQRPWIVPAAIGWLRRRIRSDWAVLELGSGRSTVWFARRAGSVLSLEDNEFWHGQTRERLEAAGLTNVELELKEVENFPVEIDSLADEAFDLVVIDFLEAPAVTRVDCLKPAMKKVRAGGYLLLDDSDRPGYEEAFELLEGWRFRKFTGVKDEWPEACETGIFRKPPAVLPKAAHSDQEQDSSGK